MKRTWIFVILALAASTGLAAQESIPPPQILGGISDSQLVTLKGNIHPSAIAGNDLGAVDSELQLSDLILVLKRSPEQQAAFDTFVESQYDSSSPNFHHWLEPGEVGALFGPSLTDIATISNWLSGHGLSVDEVSPDRMTIRFSGATARVESTFHTEIHNLMVKGEEHIGNMSDPQIPMALEPVVVGVKALHNFLPRPLHRLGRKVSLDQETGRWQGIRPSPEACDVRRASENGNATPHPEFGITITVSNGDPCNPQYSTYQDEDLAPYDFATIYNVIPLWNEGTPIDGTGQTIAIAGTSKINLSDVTAFRSIFGLPAGTAPQMIVANGTDPGQCTGTSGACTIGDQIENALDVEWSGAIAKGAKVVLVVSGPKTPATDTVYSSASYAIQHNTAKILNVSYGMCELDLGTSGNTSYKNLWQTAASQGIAVFVASGDSGSAMCDAGMDVSTPYLAQHGLSVNGLASTPYNSAVGGTDLSWGTTASPYWGTANNTSNGSNALGYVPEVPLDDSCTNPVLLPHMEDIAAQQGVSVTDAESACALFYSNPNVSSLSWFVNSWGGGGGMSACTTSDGSTLASCAGGYPKPNWQANVPGIPADGKRDLPDISFAASNGFLGTAYLMCVSANGACTYSSTSEPTSQEVGGTSIASTVMAGVMALINQKMGTPQGNPNAELYKLATLQNYANCKAETGTTSNGCLFNDIDSGTISMACQIGSPDCSLLHAADSVGLLSGYDAGTGFDLATGLGSLNVANVVNGWQSSSVGSTPATVTVTPTPGSITVNQSTTVQVAVTGSSGTPTGTVTLSGGGYTAGAATLSSGSYTFTIPANSLSAGTDTLTSNYSGDTTYASASGTGTVTVSKLTATVGVMATPTTVGPGTTVSAKVTVSGAGATPTGTVQLIGGGYTSSVAPLSNGSYTFTIPANTLSNGTDTLTATYSGDTEYTANATGSVVMTVNILTPAVTVDVSASSVDLATALNVTTTVSGSGATPTGTATLTGGGYTSAASTLTAGKYTFAVPAGSLSLGTDSLTVAYSGDSVYKPASGTNSVTVTKVTPAVSVVPGSGSIESNVAVTVTGTVTGASKTGAPTGTVTLTGGGYTSAATALAGGSYSITIPANSLSTGTDTLTVSYSGDANYLTKTGTGTVTVTQHVPLVPTVTVAPVSSSQDSGQSLDVAVSVAGSGATPTGTVTLSGGSYTSAAQTLSSGAYNFTIPANSLSAGSDTLTVTYSGDNFYAGNTGSATVTVTQSVFSLSASNATPSSVAPGNSATSTITVASTSNYSGTIKLSCTLNSGGPANSAGDSPVCSAQSAEISVNGTGTVTVATTAASSGALVTPLMNDRGRGLAGSGAVLAFLVLLGIPARRRNWWSMLGTLILMVALGNLAGCGGSSGHSSPNPGTAAGTYTFTVTGTGTPAVNPAPTTTFTVTVN